jgi:prolyl-tRNA synthetase
MSVDKLPSRVTHFSDWYNDVIFRAELIDHSPVRGTMIIRPYGYSIWEHIQIYMDKRIKETGHSNASFPLFIPQSFLQKESEHVQGFAPELAVVTHAGGKVLEEPLVVRPTSETIIHYMFARWIKSYRDLPLKINQWANVVRWEMRARPFLRTTEFLWQEGHTAHATRQEAYQEVMMMLEEYKTLASDILAIPVITGKKTDNEKFPGAQLTMTFEGLMPDGKALQMGTSHLLSQSFAHAFDMRFQNQEGELAYPYLTSWGVTTRLIGAVVMVHGDDDGLRLPPFVAPIQVVIIPIFKKNMSNDAILEYIGRVATVLQVHNIRVYVDADQHDTPGTKYYHWELKGVPIRMDIGPRDVANMQCTLVSRVDRTKVVVTLDTVVDVTLQLLGGIHKALLMQATQKRDAQWYHVDTLAELVSAIEFQPGMYQTGWCGSGECEMLLKDHKTTVRCILEVREHRMCFACSQPSQGDIIVARAY